MTYPINIIINNRIWYDSRIQESDPVVFQNVNYADGDERSVNVVRQRFMQDWARRTIPNSIRQGIGLTDPEGFNDQIDVTQGYAIVGGRFLDIPAETFSASDEGLTGDGGSPINHYLMIRVSPEIEGDGRDPSLESADLVARPISTYLATEKSHDDLVLAKFRYNGSVIDQFVDYTKEQEWQVNVISPPATRPGLSTAPTEEVLLRAGAFERIDIMNIETDKVRFYLNAVFDSQSGAATEIKLINKSGQMQISNTAEDELLGLTMLELYTGSDDGVDWRRIDSSGNLTNIGTINSNTFDGSSSNSGDIVTVDGTQTISNKTITSATLVSQVRTDSIAGTEILTFPSIVGGDTLVTKTSTDDLENKTLLSAEITDPTINTGDTLTATSTEMNQILTGHERGGTSTGDIVTIEATQTLTSKTLDTLKFWDNDDSNTAEIVVTPNLTGNKQYSIPIASDATFMMEEFDNVITSLGSLSFSANDTFVLPDGWWSSAKHTHNDDPSGGVISFDNLSDLPVNVDQGGTGISSHTSQKILVGQTGGGLSAVSLSGDGWITQSGVLTINDDSHTHHGSYYTETEMNAFLHIGSGNKNWCPLIYMGSNEVDDLIDGNTGYAEIKKTTAGWDYHSFDIPLPLQQHGKTLYITQIKYYLSEADSVNEVRSISEYWWTNSGGNDYTLDSTTRESPGEYTVTGINRTMTNVKRWGITIEAFSDTSFNVAYGYIIAEYYYV